MKTVTIIAPTGMLGNMVYRELKDHFNILLVYRDEKKLELLEKTHGKTKKGKKIKFELDEIFSDYLLSFPNEKISPNTKKLVELLGEVDAVINCAGVTKPHSLSNPANTFFINGVLPNVLSSIYKEKFIQIATDCVYDGLSGAPYNESSAKNPNDLYGLSKSLGEPVESLVLRTSIIGPELGSSDLLLEWFKRQGNQKINGYTNHLWNGITTKQFGTICKNIIEEREKFPKNGIYHVFSSTLTKYEMLKKFEGKYKINADIIPVKAETAIDRRLDSNYDFCKLLNIPDFDEMLSVLP